MSYIGTETVAVLLETGDVLKIGQYPVLPQRPFDAPAIDYGFLEGISYTIQPYVNISCSWDELWEFEKFISEMGYCLIDPSPGTYNGRWVLVDYNTVCLDDGNFSLDDL